MKIIEITKVFTMDAYPKKITKDDGIDIFSDEYLIGCLLVETFGGSLRVLKENSGIKYVKFPDYLWNGKLWDLKTCTSITAIHNRIRVGIKQISKKPGGIILVIKNGNIEKRLIIKNVVNRMLITKESNYKVIVIDKNKEIQVFIKK